MASLRPQMTEAMTLKVGDHLTFPGPFGCAGAGPHSASVVELELSGSVKIEFDRTCSDGKCPASKWVKRG